jgi:hypothetical protein
MSHRLSLSTRANLLKLTPVVSLSLLCAAMAGPLRAEDKLDKKVVEICKKVGDLYKNAKTLRTEGTIVTKIVNDGQKREITVTAVYEIERPNRLSFKSQVNGDAKKGPDVICDGKTLTVYRKAIQKYVQEDAPKDVSGLRDKSCSYVGMDKVDGTPAHHMKFSQDQFDWEMWVASEGKPFVLRMKQSVDGGNGKATTTETYKNSTVDATAAKGAFTFTPPKDATKVDEFKESN